MCYLNNLNVKAANYIDVSLFSLLRYDFGYGLKGKSVVLLLLSVFVLSFMICFFEYYLYMGCR